ncbi:MAG: DUF4815 domain-containing protein [Desulfovibrio sp.]|jgi:hypothetical protein|nr:DUF4815 domain-containing protein [Desulfovibrio sp.]
MADYPVSYPVQDYYNRFTPAKNYEKLLVRDGYRIQGAETNDMQEGFLYRMKGLADALFKDGDVIRDAQISVNSQTGDVQAGSGIIYINGGMRAIPAATFQIPLAGQISVGIYMSEKIISELDDPALKNPAIGLRGEGEPGAWRLQVNARWGFYGDGATGDFYPVYVVEDGILQAKEAPPNLDAFNQGIARYDRDSTAGGTYIVSGLVVRAAELTGGGSQAYTVSEGRARVYGYGIELPTSRRLAYNAQPDLRFVDTEIHMAEGVETQRIDVAHAPISSITQLRITKQKTASVVHGAYSGAADALPDPSVVSIVECRQGETVYTPGTDYKKTGDTVDWSPTGNEPAPGSTYSCIYTCVVAVSPEDPDYDGFSVIGAVAGSSIILSYNQALPRVDRLCLTQEGSFIWVKGVSAEYNSRPASPAEGVLALATVYQDWRGAPARVVNDGIRVISFADIEAMTERLDYLLAELARQRLEADVFTREAGARVGIFVDPLIDDSNRDQGIEQTAAIVNGELLLPIAADIRHLPTLLSVAVPAYTPIPVLSQLLRTGSMQVNPYMAFDVLPARVTLNPAIDQWTDVETQWTSSETQRFDIWIYAPNDPRHGQTLTNSSVTNQVVGSTTKAQEYLRQISVGFSIKGFGPGEILQQVIFDGVTASFDASAADANGELTGSFVIPPKIPSGAKTVVFRGSDGGSFGSAVFIGQGQLTVQTVRQVTTVTNYHIDPLAQTFALEKTIQVCGVDIWFTAKSGEVRIQIRDVRDGVPTRTILAEAVLDPAQIVVTGGGHTRALFEVPVQLQSGNEYAIVVLCNDPETAVCVAEMNKFDQLAQKWVSSQPYTIGVLLSSSNASTWTAHQERDMTFRLLEAQFASGVTQVNMGNAEVDGATDLVVVSVDERPTAATHVEYVLTLPDGSAYTVDQSQPMRLPSPVSGAISVTAHLKGTTDAAPILWPGAELLVGAVSQIGTYYSRSIPALDAIKAVLIYDAVIPSGASVAPEIQIDGASWQALTDPGTVQEGDGIVEYSYSAELSGATLIKLRITLTGTTQARPSVRNIRFMAIK